MPAFGRRRSEPGWLRKLQEQRRAAERARKDREAVESKREAS